MPKSKTVEVRHPKSGEVSKIKIPADHDGSRVKVEFPDGETAYTDGFDPAERALSGGQVALPCGNCGSSRTLSGASGFVCSACGARNVVEVRVSSDKAQGSSAEG